MARYLNKLKIYCVLFALFVTCWFPTLSPQQFVTQDFFAVPSPGRTVVGDDGFFPLGSSCGGYVAEGSVPPLFDVTNLKEPIPVGEQKDSPDAPPTPSFADVRVQVLCCVVGTLQILNPFRHFVAAAAAVASPLPGQQGTRLIL